MSIRTPQNPGLGGLDELTDAEELFLTSFAGLSANNNDVLSFVSGAPIWQNSITVPVVNSAIWRFATTVGVKMSTSTAVGRDVLTIEATSGSDTDMVVDLLAKGDGVAELRTYEIELSNLGTKTTSTNTVRIGGADLSAGDAGFLITTENETAHLFASKSGIGLTSPTAKLHVHQTSTTGAMPVLTLDQADVDEDFFKFIGTSDTNVDRALVDAVDFSTPGSIVGWLKINIQDDQSTNPITDGDYYLPFYSAPTA